MFDLQSPETRFGLKAVRQSCTLVSQVQQELVSSAITKEDRSPVTVADFASQALVAHLLAEEFPQDPLVAEEDSTALQHPTAAQSLEQVTRFVGRQFPAVSPQEVCNWIDLGGAQEATRFWTLDPIDGTKGFLRNDQYAIALALIIEGQVQIGVLGCPKLVHLESKQDKPGLLVFAVRGKGSWAASLTNQDEFHPLNVSNQTDPHQARILRSFESGHTNPGKTDDFARVLGVQAEPVRLDSQAKYAILAAGGGELYLRLLSSTKPDYREKIWDQAAGSLILEEAGGRITDLDGKALDFSQGRTLAFNRGILASNSLLHESALQALREVGA